MSRIVFTGGMVSQHALQVSRPTTRGKVEGSGLGGGLQAHIQGEVEGSGLGGLQSHNQGGKLRGLACGVSRSIPWGVSRHTPGACTEAETSPPAPPPQTATAAGGTTTSYWNAFLYFGLLRNSTPFVQNIRLATPS